MSNAPTVNKAAIDRAFAHDSSLRKRVYDAIEETPNHADLFGDIAEYHLKHQSVNGADGAASDEPASKKRKLANNGSLPIPVTQTNAPRQVILEARDLSFSLPQRKKLHLGLAQYGTDIDASTTTFAIYTRNPASNEVEMEVPLDLFAYALRLPVPEKAAKQYNYVILPKPDAKVVSEPIIWTVNHGPLKSCHFPQQEIMPLMASEPDEILEKVLRYILKKVGVTLTLPSAEEFASARPESHRKSDKAYHVKAFRGSKDGFLFFLHNGIFFGFKKPLSFFAFGDIVSVSYTSVLQRTFNLNIVHRSDEDPDAHQEVEFSMLDQADFPGIDAYIRRHGLQDASLAESRRAQKSKAAGAGANGKGTPAASGEGAEGDDEDSRTELEKAAQQMEDEEDEEEEDYDPGSEGESEGSEEDSEDEDEGYERERKKTKGRNIVAEELGSEAEDVSVTEDEGGDEDHEGEEDEAGDEEDEEEEDDDHEEEEEEEEEIGQDPQGFEIGQHVKAHGFSAVAPAAQNGIWTGMPDPDDDDQL
ncbi:hypothetical protein H2202_006199 [Exophiala xenobiotica]|nr:hypothetical protein H2202_006199 [Exophiala xenobiotica]KAK5253486.1 hypothetical protein LTS06_002197 [Exophiala xenobiotica]KAK5346610.1 hypothetical protein LTR61_009558 [Exophiala xenobiotica]KAK5363310.1 hypothetical protein LTS03_009656 [Exophiala xenobiotica]KAK5406139.1 hypothetical protein LTR06_008494 [Exophiala xenobiotica]